MRRIFTAILISVSLLALDARLVFCRQATAARRDLTQDVSTSRESEGVQQQQSTNAAQATRPPLDERARKVKRTVEKIGVGGRITLYLKNGEELYGSVVRYDEESLQVTEIDLKQVITVQYANIKKVRENYGRPNIFTGKRNNPPKGARYGALAAAFFLVLALPIILLASAKD